VLGASVSQTLIIIVTWNTVEDTKACLDSLFTNRVNDYCDIAVIDNASSDNTAQILADRFPDIILLENVENVGFAAANNIVMQRFLGKYDYFLLLNSDTLVIGDVVEDYIRFLDKNFKTGVMGCRVLNSDRSVQYTCSGFPDSLSLLSQLIFLDKLTKIPLFQRYRMLNWGRDSERNVSVVSGCFFLVRCSVIKDVGCFDEDFFFFGEETDLCYRIARAGWEARFSPVGEIIHHGSLSAKKLNFRRDLLLSNAIVRFNSKNIGAISGLISFMILFLFNFSRMTLHAIAAPISSDSRERAVHFFKVVSRFKYAWHAFKSKNIISIR
jgi:GT2 family glycosyltransferase